MNARVRKLLPAIVLAGALPLAMLPGTTAAQTNDVVAKVGDTAVTGTDVKALLDTLQPKVRQAVLSDPATMKEVLQTYLKEIPVYNEARAKSWDKRADVQAQIAAATRKIVLTSYLNSVAVVPADYPSDKEMQAWYDQNKAHIVRPRTYRTSEIFVAVPANADAQTVQGRKARAEDLARQAQAKGADFAALAKANSDAPNASSGGDAGFLPENDIVPQVRTAISGMQKGDVSEPISMTGGFAIVRLTDTHPAEVPPLSDAEVAADVRALLRETQQMKLANDYANNLLKSNPVVINASALSKAVDQERPGTAKTAAPTGK